MRNGKNTIMTANRIIYCNSDCGYSSNSGVCMKKDDMLMLWARPKKSKQFYPKVFCDNYISKKKEKSNENTKEI